MDFKDYYKILGVTKTSTQDEIKKSYRQLAMKYHPDKNPGDKSAEDTFKDIQEAYNVLSDPKKKKKYDDLGSSYNQYSRSNPNVDFDWSQWFAQKQSTRKKTSTKFDDFMNDTGSSNDFFERIFGSKYKKQSSTTSNNPKTAEILDITQNIEITLEEAYNGTNKQILINSEKIELNIKAGIANKQTLKLTGKGNRNSIENRVGDLYVTINIKESNKIERKDNDLFLEFPIDLYKAILGGISKIKTFGGTIKLNIPKESQNGKILKVTGMGFPLYNQKDKKGDLYITLIIKIPENLTEKEIELFTELQKLRNSQN